MKFVKCEVCGKLIEISPTNIVVSCGNLPGLNIPHAKFIWDNIIYYTNEFSMCIEENYTLINRKTPGSKFYRRLLKLDKVISYNEFIDGVNSGKWLKLAAIS